MNDSSQEKAVVSILNSPLVLPLILLLATLLRVIYIGHHSFWVDELFSLKFASYSLPDLFREVADFDNHPATYYVLLHFWMQIFGDSEVSLRMPSAIFSVLSVYFTFKAAELLFDRQVASIAALLLALSGFSIYYAQEARMYSLLALSSVLSVYFLLKYLDRQTSGTLFNFVWATTLLVYTHLYGIFIIVAENIYILAVLYRFGDRDLGVSLKKWITVQAAVFVLSIPWFVLLIKRILNIAHEDFWVEVPIVDSVVRTFAAFSGTYRGLALWILLMIVGVLSALPRKTGFGRKVFRERSTENAGWHVLLLLLLVFTPILVPYLISKFTTPIYIIRSTIAAQFAFYLLVAKGIASLRWTGFRLLALVLVIAVLLKPLLRDGYVRHDATDFRRAVDYLVANASDKDKIILCSHSHLTWPFKYYAKKRGLESETVKFGANETVSDLLNMQKGWYVALADRKSQCDPELQALSNEYTRLDIEELAATNIEITAFVGNR